MSVQLVETYEEDSYAAVAQFVADLLNDGEVGCHMQLELQPARFARMAMYPLDLYVALLSLKLLGFGL